MKLASSHVHSYVLMRHCTFLHRFNKCIIYEIIETNGNKKAIFWFHIYKNVCSLCDWIIIYKLCVVGSMRWQMSPCVLSSSLLSSSLLSSPLLSPLLSSPLLFSPLLSSPLLFSPLLFSPLLSSPLLSSPLLSSPLLSSSLHLSTILENELLESIGEFAFANLPRLSDMWAYRFFGEKKTNKVKTLDVTCFIQHARVFSLCCGTRLCESTDRPNSGVQARRGGGGAHRYF